MNERSLLRDPIDAFVLARLEPIDLALSAEATPAELLRRASFDLVGLPPSPEEIEEALLDVSGDAYERAVDRWIDSPRFGERWGRSWLDLARYADSNGFEHDEARPDAWRYRDWVIASLNADLSYDRLVLAQLAGDLIWPEDPGAIVATGFNLLGPDMTDASDQAWRRHLTLVDMTDTAAAVFLGLTAGCARCHDHKSEPVTQRDYYRLLACFAPAAFRADAPAAGPEERRAHERAMERYRERARPVEEAIARLEAPARLALREVRIEGLAEAAREAHRLPPERRTPAQRELAASTERFLAVKTDEVRARLSAEERRAAAALDAELAGIGALRPPPLPRALALEEKPGAPARAEVLVRGEAGRSAGSVEAGVPEVLAVDGGAGVEGAGGGLGAVPLAGGARRALAEWIVEGGGRPLSARVIVNRIWQGHFGRGLAPSPSDLGTRSEAPSHRELLDWLAAELVESGWSLKSLHRRIVLSATYRQGSRASAEALRIDPENRLLARAPIRRLDAEAVRDALLAASGRLNLTMGGPGVLPPLPEELGVPPSAWPVTADRSQILRRTVYLFQRRNLRFPFLEAFDPPDANQSCPRRGESVSAPQALAMLNAREALESAGALAQLLEREKPAERDRIREAWLRLLSRPPTAREEDLAHQFLAASPLSELCRALLSTAEFLTVE